MVSSAPILQGKTALVYLATSYRAGAGLGGNQAASQRALKAHGANMLAQTAEAAQAGSVRTIGGVRIRAAAYGVIGRSLPRE